MPRTARTTVVNAPHHVYQRTLKNRRIFYSDKDRQTYLKILREQAQKYRLDILAYCLMGNYIHLVVIPRRQNSMAKTIGRTNFSYTQYINKRRKRAGTLWRNRFQSCALDDKHMKIAVQFVECLPIYERLVRKPEKYPWSSAKAHITGQDEHEVLALKVWPSRQLRRKWADFLRKKLSIDTRERLRTYTQTGRPLGSKAFVEKLEKKFRRRLHPLPVGRPPKKT